MNSSARSLAVSVVAVVLLPPRHLHRYLQLLDRAVVVQVDPDPPKHPQNPTQVAVLMDVADMDALMRAMQTKELADAMEYDGVLPESLVILVES